MCCNTTSTSITTTSMPDFPHLKQQQQPPSHHLLPPPLPMMLPPELVEDICEHLDLTSVCALAEADMSALAVTDDVFKRMLEPLCPWFEPQFSHRNSYRECAIEYLRRQQPGAKFAPRLRKVRAEEFGAVEEKSPDCPVYGQQENALADFCASAKQLRSAVYTSEHGIKVELTRKKDYWSWCEEKKSKIVSLPHVLIIMTLDEDELYCCGGCNLAVIVKFKDSLGLKPDFVKYDGVDDYSIECMGPHVFLLTQSSSCYGAEPWLNVRYLDKNGFHGVLYLDMEETYIRAFCYDGLLQYFIGKKYCAIQPSLDEGTEIFTDKLWSKHVVDYAEETTSLIRGDCRYSLIRGRKEKKYVLDISRGLVVNAEELAESGKVDRDLISMMKSCDIDDTYE